MGRAGQEWDGVMVTQLRDRKQAASTPAVQTHGWELPERRGGRADDSKLDEGNKGARCPFIHGGVRLHPASHLGAPLLEQACIAS